MSKGSKKRKFPKISKLGKYFKLKRSSKKENDVEGKQEEETQGGLDTPTCVPQYAAIPGDLYEEETQEDKITLKEEVETTDKVVEIKDLDSKGENSLTNEKTVTSSFNGNICHVQINNTRSDSLDHEQNTNSISVASEISLQASTTDKSIEKEFSNSGQNCTLDNEVSQQTTSTLSAMAADTSFPLPSTTSAGVTTPTNDSMTERDELIYPVLVQTPFQLQKTEEEKEASGCKSSNTAHNSQPITCNVVVHTPQPIKKTAEKRELKSEAKTTVDDDDEFVLSELPDTPTPEKLEKRASQRMFTVKKIRSIIATPYKRLKRDHSSLVDGLTYRYIEIQSLVKAFETLHSCKGGMVAYNEKGIQYGKSSVLRVECKDCDTKVFLQATKA